MDATRREKHLAEREAQDLTLALLLLKADLAELMTLRFLPDVLDRLDLPFSRMALLYALGYEDQLRKEGSIPESESSEALLSLFCDFMKQSAVSDLPLRPTALEAGEVSFVSPVLGCRILARAEADYGSQRLAERILAGIEALLATSLDERLFPYLEELVIFVQRRSTHRGAPQVVDGSSSTDTITVVHSGSVSDRAEGEEQPWFLHIVATVISRFVLIEDPDSYMQRVFGEESGLARSLNFTESAIAMSNLIGSHPKIQIPDWNIYHNPRPYIPKRENVWHGGAFAERRDKMQSDPKFGTGEIPTDILDRKNRKHTDRKVSSLIDIALWDKAEWSGTLYIWPMDLDEEPWVALAFKNVEAGRAIFKSWRDRFGEIDAEERIRISVLTGVDRLHPTHYKVLLGSNLLESALRVKEVVLSYRINKMTPDTSFNLDAFVTRLQRVGTYQLMPAQMVLDGSKYRPFPDLGIQKRQFNVRPAWRIEEHDPDGIGIMPGDDPFIPAEIQDAPVLRLLKRKRGRPQRSD
jgi:hypothetical protein